MVKVIEDACQIKEGRIVKLAMITVEGQDLDELMKPGVHDIIKDFLETKGWNAAWTGRYSVIPPEVKDGRPVGNFRMSYEYMFRS